MKTPFKVFSREDVFHSLFPFLSLLKSLIPSSPLLMFFSPRFLLLSSINLTFTFHSVHIRTCHPITA